MQNCGAVVSQVQNIRTWNYSIRPRILIWKALGGPEFDPGVTNVS